jgi:presenilin-like A22 family membrane protease
MRLTSTVVFVESFIVVTLSVFTVVESVVVELAEPLQAAKAPITRTVNNFFIVICLIVNDFMLILGFEKSNLLWSLKSFIILLIVYSSLIISILYNKNYPFDNLRGRKKVYISFFSCFALPFGLRIFTFSIK